ncbi:MAG: glycosyltransferase family 4 protein [Ignavibacteria bacterium]|nr:glycosyltransferase family 4 protein [Ignavibacteria bacterium]
MKKSKNKIRVVYVGSFEKEEILSGPEKVAKRIFTEFSGEEKSLFITYFQEGKKFGYLKKLFGNETICKINKSEVIMCGLFPFLIKIISVNPQIIHLITFSRFAVIVLVLKYFMVFKLFFNLHGIVTHENRYFRKESKFTELKNKIIEELIIKFCDFIFCLSEDNKKLLHQYYNINDKKMFLINNGVDEVFFNVNKRIHFSASTVLKIVFISDITRAEKGFVFLRDSLNEVNFDCELHIISENKKLLIINKHFKIFYYNFMNPSELAEFFADKDIIISASFYEPFGISIAEAVVSGLLPVVTEETGFSRFITNKVNGYVYKYGNKNELATILNILNLNRGELFKANENSINKYNELKWSNILSLYKKYYFSNR